MPGHYGMHKGKDAKKKGNKKPPKKQGGKK
jgi:hypothetical protein